MRWKPGLLPLDAMAVPGVPSAFLAPFPHGLGMLEVHPAEIHGNLAFYLSRVVRTDSFPEDF